MNYRSTFSDKDHRNQTEIAKQYIMQFKNVIRMTWKAQNYYKYKIGVLINCKSAMYLERRMSEW